MKKCYIVIFTALLIGCAPSLIQRDVDKSLNVRYEITKNEEKKIKGSALKIADSLTIKALKRKIDGNESLKNWYLKIHIDELKWFCPDRSKIEAEGFVAGFAGGFIGASIWGTKNFTTVYGISNIKVQGNIVKGTEEIICSDTIHFKENYMNYSSSKTKKRAITEVYTKFLDCMFSKIEEDATQGITIKNEEPPQ